MGWFGVTWVKVVVYLSGVLNGCVILVLIDLILLQMALNARYNWRVERVSLSEIHRFFKWK